jgi:YesN/AraC family two-component response regulator
LVFESKPGNGHEAVEAAQVHAGSIDLLMTDVIMPDMNGRALSQQLLDTIPDLPTLLISGYTASVIAHHGVLDEGVEFLEKPFTQRHSLYATPAFEYSRSPVTRGLP